MKGIHQTSAALCLVASLFCFSTNSLANTYGEPFNFYEPAPNKILSNVEKYHLNQGIDKVKQGKYEYAWSEFAFMLHYFPNHPKALQLISDLSVQMENPARAERYFERAIRLYPNESETHALHGIFLHKLGRYQESVDAYKRAIALNDKPVDYHYNLGLAYYEMKDFKEALQQAEIAYNKGYPLPGLKDKLKAVDVWPKESKKS